MDLKAALVRSVRDMVDLQLRFLSAAEVEHSPQYYLFTGFHRSNRLQQLQEMERWARVQATTGRPLAFHDVAFSVHSGNGQDGILLYILQLLGPGSRRIVDIGGSDGVQGNSCNLIVNHGFEALIIDGNSSCIATGRRFYSRCRLLFNNWPVFAPSMVTKDNIEGTLREHGFEGEVDILSLDIDGNDFHILQAIKNVRPRVIVLEFNSAFAPGESMVFPYDERSAQTFVGGFLYGGASLAAFTKMLREKNYRLVGVDPGGQDAYFVSNDCVSPALPERSVDDCFGESRSWQRSVTTAKDSAIRQQRWDAY
jgi:hypothetical protein